jgi:hypothetical protein
MLLLPFSLLAAGLLESWAGRSGGPSTPERMGTLPLPVAGGLAAVEAARAVRRRVGPHPILEAGTRWGTWATVGRSALFDAFGAPPDWDPRSLFWVTSVQALSGSASAAGHPVDPVCTWLFSGQLRLLKRVQEAAEVLVRQHPMVPPRVSIAQVNEAWQRTASTLSSPVPNFLRIPDGAGPLTQSLGNAEALAWALFAGHLLRLGVTAEDLWAIEDTISAAELRCKDGIQNVPTSIRRGFAQYLVVARDVRRAILRWLLDRDGANVQDLVRAPFAQPTLDALQSAVVFTRRGDHVDAALTGALFDSLRDALDAIAVETSGVLPPDRAMVRADGLGAVLVGEDGQTRAPGLVVPGRYRLRFATRPTDPTVFVLDGGHAYVFSSTAGVVGVQDHDLRPVL